MPNVTNQDNADQIFRAAVAYWLTRWGVQHTAGFLYRVADHLIADAYNTGKLKPYIIAKPGPKK